MIGTILSGRYEILEEVGAGGMAHVYKAQCNVLNRIVAVKVLRNDLEGGEEFINRFKAEAQAAAGLTHPNIVSIFDVGEENGLYYIVMEYIEGITLKEYIKQKGRISPEEGAKIASQICGALSVAHEKNIIHRDIKPHNIMITNTELVKVTDFGIARASNNSTMRVGDAVLGSVHYISPEQARGGYVDCRTDIYSLGIVLYEMLTGKVPFESDSPIAVAMKHLEEIPVEPTTLCPDIPDELQRVVLKAMSKETRKRYQTVDGLKSDLDIVAAKLKANSDSIFFAGEVSSADENIHEQDIEEVKDEQDEYIDEFIQDDEENDSNDEYIDFDDSEEINKPQKSPLNMILAAVLIALVVVGGGFFGAMYFINPDAPIFMFFKNNDIDVPAFTGMNIKKAEELAKQYGLVLQIGDKKPGPDPADTVIYQNIEKGNSVKKGTVVTVHLSAGPDNWDLASYRGMDESVIDEFRDMGYDVDVKYKSSTDMEENKIISVTQKGNEFIFTVSTGSGEVDCVVPNVLRMTKSQAKEKLEANGLLLNERVTYIESNTVDADLVVEQSKAEGEKVSPKTKISIILSSGKKDKPEKEEGDKDTEGSGENTNLPQQNDETKSETNVETNTEKADVPTNSEAVQEKEKTFQFNATQMKSAGVIKIVEKRADGATSVIFEQHVDPTVTNKIVRRVKGTGTNEYQIYQDGVLINTTTVNFN